MLRSHLKRLGGSISSAIGAVPAVTITAQTLSHDTGASATDRVTSDGSVRLSGTVTGLSGATVQILDGTTVIGTATVSGKGNWSFATTLTDGSHTLTAVARDSLGQTASSSAQPAIIVDTSTPVVRLQYENQVVGSNTVEIYGTLTASAGTTVQIYANGVAIGTATVSGTTWHYSATNLAAGDTSFSAVATTIAGRSATFGGLASLTVGTAEGTLDRSRFVTVWSQDFVRAPVIDRTIFPIVYGNADEFAFDSRGLTLTSYQSEGFNNVGFLQANWGANLAQGYGLYSVTASHPSNQGAGIAILLWPSNNVWPGPELDILENWSDPTGQTGYATVHTRTPDGQDLANAIRFPVDLTVPNTFSLDWERGSLTYYVNGQEIIHITGSEVPLDAADGGVNASFGAQITDIGHSVQPSDAVSLTIAAMSYSAPVAAGQRATAVFCGSGGTPVVAAKTQAAAAQLLAQAITDLPEGRSSFASFAKPGPAAGAACFDLAAAVDAAVGAR